MRTLDQMIYGLDENEFASSIASDALGAPNENRKSGGPISQDMVSHGNKPYALAETGEAKKVGKFGLGWDKRACPSGNHGKSGCND